MKSPDEILIEHALATLPDSLAKRKDVLNAVHQKIASAHPDWMRVQLMLEYLRKHEEQQMKLPLMVPKKKTGKGRPARDGNGNGNNDGDGKGDGDGK